MNAKKENILKSQALSVIRQKKQQYRENKKDKKRRSLTMEHIKSTNFELVEDFMEATGEETLLEPVFPEERIQRLRIDLIEKELDELTYAIDNVDIVEVANALTELLYVVYGTGHAFGLDLDECLKEVHASNMSTLGPEGPIINEGEVLRPDTYFPPDLKTVLNIN